MPRSILHALGILVAGMSFGCSENFGPAPPDGGSRIAVRSESITGPRTDRVGTALNIAGNAVVVGTDAGLFRFQAERPDRWIPLQGGFLTVDGEPRVGVVAELAMARDGGLLFFRGRLGPTDALVASGDGGLFFDRLARPDPLQTSVDAIGVAGPGPLGDSGAWLAIQGGQIFSRPVGGESWSGLLLPRAPLEVTAIAAAADGRLAVAVAATAADDWTVWTNSMGDRDLEETGLGFPGRIHDMIWHAGDLLVATTDGIWSGESRVVTWPQARVLDAALASTESEAVWALVGLLADGSVRLATGSGPGPVSGATDLPSGTVVDVAASATGGRVLYGDGSTSGGTERDPYGGVELDLSALAVEEGTRILAVGQSRTGDVYQGPLGDPDGYTTRGAPLRASVPRAIRFDPEVDDALFVASFGVYRSDPSTAAWFERNNGFSSYDPGFFAGPFPVSAFSIWPEGEFWVGGINGDGPYRSVNSGLTWDRMHAGLGEPGSYETEPGLPLVTQVQAFARDGAGVRWMGGFRGGAFRLEESDGVWGQMSRGLPKIDGVPLDDCCPVPGETEVDVRDLVATDDGSLLAATGWGIYRLLPGGSDWQDRSTGLFNRDVTRLLVHPRDRGIVLAACRGRPDAPDWLFLSEDAGRTWFPVDSGLLGRVPVDLDWTDPERFGIVVLLQAQGAWRMELDP